MIYLSAGGTDKTDTNYDDKNGIRSLCISPDSKHLASGDRIGNIRWDLQLKRNICLFVNELDQIQTF